MRVFHVIPKPLDNRSGMIFAHRQIRAIAAQGVECEEFLLRVRLTPAGILKALWKLRRAIRTAAPDIVHAQFGTITGFLSALATTRPLIVTFHGGDLNRDVEVGRLRSATQTLLSQFAALRAQGIICVSKRLRKRLWWRADRAIIVPSGVDLDEFRPLDYVAARRQLGWAEDEHVIFFNVGAQPITKRIDLAEAATEQASRLLGRAVRLLVLRDTPPSEIPLLMNAADCLLMTSLIEGSPTVIKEAMACIYP